MQSRKLISSKWLRNSAIFLWKIDWDEFWRKKKHKCGFKSNDSVQISFNGKPQWIL